MCYFYLVMGILPGKSIKQMILQIQTTRNLLYLIDQFIFLLIDFHILSQVKI